jgi:hypothetical protein
VVSAAAGPQELRLALDKVLPRVVELCVEFGSSGGGGGGSSAGGSASATGKQTLLAAAETLHCVVLVALGRTVEEYPRPTESSYKPVLQAALPACLALAVSGEPTVRLLFHKLLFQLARWYSDSKQGEQGVLLS